MYDCVQCESLSSDKDTQKHQDQPKICMHGECMLLFSWFIYSVV